MQCVRLSHERFPSGELTRTLFCVESNSEVASATSNLATHKAVTTITVCICNTHECWRSSPNCMQNDMMLAVPRSAVVMSLRLLEQPWLHTTSCLHTRSFQERPRTMEVGPRNQHMLYKPTSCCLKNMLLPLYARAPGPPENGGGLPVAGDVWLLYGHALIKNLATVNFQNAARATFAE